MLDKLSLPSLIYINLGLGFFIAVTNGAALAFTLTGHGGNLIGMIPEIAAWIAAGLVLSSTSGYALVRKDSVGAIVQLQSFAVLLLVIALVIWATSILLSGTPEGHRVVWSVGYLSIAAAYAAILFSRVFGDPRYSLHRRLLTWCFIPFCVVVDIATFIKVAGGFI
jgi:hypothetical protein